MFYGSLGRNSREVGSGSPKHTLRSWSELARAMERMASGKWGSKQDPAWETPRELL